MPLFSSFTVYATTMLDTNKEQRLFLTDGETLREAAAPVNRTKAPRLSPRPGGSFMEMKSVQ